MRKNGLVLTALMAGFIVTPSLTSCGGSDLTVFNWGEYMSMDVLHAFEKEYDVKVKLRTYDSNELMLSKLETTDYDVIFPSDYAVEELASKNKLLEIDYDLIDFDPATEMVPSLYSALDNLKDDGFDLLKYAVPYTWGEIGILYNTEKISKEEIERDGWDALKNPTNADGSKRTAVVYNAARDLFSMALVANGLSFVDVTDDNIETAAEWLKDMKDTMGDQMSYKTEEILDDMPALRYDICFTYVGDAIYAMDNVVNRTTGEKDPSLLDFYIPDSTAPTTPRTNIYCDAMAITTDCKNVDLAHKFINFMTTHDAAYENTLEIGYTTPRNDVYEEVTSENSEYEEGEGSFYPVRNAYRIEAQDNDYFYRYDEELKIRLETEWNTILTSRV